MQLVSTLDLGEISGANHKPKAAGDTFAYEIAAGRVGTVDHPYVTLRDEATPNPGERR